VRPRARNREGDPVDPVPFLVTASAAFLVTFSFVPVYCLTLGLPIEAALAAAALVFVAAAGLAYRRLVRDARPELRREVPPGLRIRQLFYVALVVVGLLVLVSLPLLIP
jgi:hypothetical protein